MKTYDFSTGKDHAYFYITIDGDIMDTMEEAELTGPVQAKIVVDGFFVGSLDDMRANALKLYINAKSKEKNYPKNTRIKLGLNQAEMADLMGVNRNTWAKWERGERRLTAAPEKLLKTITWLSESGLIADWIKEV